MDSFARALTITSASPEHTNRVKEVEFFGEGGDFDSVLRADVVRIIQDEIKIQMTEVKEDVEKKTPKGSVGSQVTQNINKAVTIAENPASMASQLMSKLPHAAVVALALKLYPIIIEHLTRPGGPMDIRFRRKIELEWNGFLDRQTQKNTQLGIRGVRIQSSAGFIQLSGGSSGNSMRLQKDPSKELNRQDILGTNAHKVLYDGL